MVTIPKQAVISGSHPVELLHTPGKGKFIKQSGEYIFLFRNPGMIRNVVKHHYGTSSDRDKL